MIKFTLNKYDKEGKQEFNNDYPVVYIFGYNSITIEFCITINSAHYYHEINYDDDDNNSYIDLYRYEKSIKITGTPLHNLIMEILKLYNVEYDQELFNGYIMKIYKYVKEIENVLNDGIGRMINLSSDNKSSRNV